MAKRPSLTGGNANIESKPKKTRQEMVSILNTVQAPVTGARKRYRGQGRMSEETPAPKTYGYVVGRRPADQEHPDKETESNEEE